MQQRLPSLLDPPLGFAHRGARAHAPENTIEAFELALRLGASGLETDVWVTRDGVAVLDHDGVVQKGVRRRKIADLHRADLPDTIPSLAELVDAVGVDVPLSLDVCDPAAYEPIVDTIRAAGAELAGRTWLCDPDVERLVERRAELSDFKLVHSTRLSKLPASPEQHAHRLQRDGIDAMNMHRTDWSGGLVVLFHRFERLAFCWDLQFDHQLEPAVRMGLDAVYSDHVDTMADVMLREVGG
ncbi:MAG: glycerophosphodiester phosphodiesterase [Actinomycetota bacterium]